MLLYPSRGVPERPGVGFQKAGVSVQRFYKALEDGLATVRRTGVAPLRWHRSNGFGLRKSAAKGLEGRRVIHVLDPIGKGYYAQLFASGAHP
eukprot:14234896-Alexandrium_andersonii.AAC.1